jgi:hypothetical protein
MFALARQAAKKAAEGDAPAATPAAATTPAPANPTPATTQPAATPAPAEGESSAASNIRARIEGKHRPLVHRFLSWDLGLFVFVFV